jgi:hypothetical protein
MPTAEDLLPPSVWRTAEFPGGLNGKIREIATVPLQPATKLHTIYRAINTFFTKRIKSRDRAIDESASDNQKTREAVQEFITNASSLLSLPPVTLRDFLDDRSGLLGAISDLNGNYSIVLFISSFENFDSIVVFQRSTRD